MNFSELFDRAANLTLAQIGSGEFILQSEKDIQALVFHQAIVLAQESGLPLDIHAEPARMGKEPDLVLGEDEVFVETKLSKAGSGGYSTALGAWHSDIDKLRKYKSKWPTARCIFLAVDEAGYHSSPSSLNFFDPTSEGLRGIWAQVTSASSFLLAEI